VQCPDVIIDLYSVGLLGKDRIGYVRKPVAEINDKPVWLHFRSLEK